MKNKVVFTASHLVRKRDKGSQIPSYKFQVNIIFVTRMSQDMGKTGMAVTFTTYILGSLILSMELGNLPPQGLAPKSHASVSRAPHSGVTHMYTRSCTPTSEKGCSFHLPYSAAHVATGQQRKIQEAKGCSLRCDTLLLPRPHLHSFKDPLEPSSEHLTIGYFHHFWL